MIKSDYKHYLIGLYILTLGIPSPARPSLSVPMFKGIEAKSNAIYTKKSFVSEALKKSGPAVVTIETKKRVITNNRSKLPQGFLIDEYFERFFGIPNFQYPKSSIERRQGSGVIFSTKGLVLTNAHVVEGTDELIVGLSNGQRVSGKVVGQDMLTDLAVIRLDTPGPWPKAVLGNSEKIEVGDWAIAVGNPYGLEKTVTLGIISNLNRNVSQLGIADKRLNLIQTDAAINPGNSGGPLLNAQGEVIGINTLVRSGPGAGLGFAIPINKAINIANQLVLKGKAIHPMIGVHLANINEDGNRFENQLKQGALIIYILPNGPADKEGLMVNDIIMSVNEEKIRYPQDVVNFINNNGVNKEIQFTILRRSRILKINIKPEDISKFRRVR
ncbi:MULTISPECIES: trypsin-like peptidase domain-containing protein [unclassified Prochlorococcus]|uniref:trypsin-like peptidase domain-containing protein n=1 Tax=unclassified Prochlorococcus TaxID=2627481 RepID=UPI00053399DD|nr:MULTISPECIES: trypsin-like peptidase domain-containing protein [unclassified Prochlorococcus]KGG16850.1 putative serine protease [Prochlorococcus sp. MIT 0602]KGG18176.1 putative serine protease [Prochlorococcus sp. MIT 0603]